MDSKIISINSREEKQLAKLKAENITMRLFILEFYEAGWRDGRKGLPMSTIGADKARMINELMAARSEALGI